MVGCVPGWKLVPKRGDAEVGRPDWGHHCADQAEVVPADEVLRIETIGTVEKVAKRHKLDPEKVIYPRTEKESSGTTLVSEKDGRPSG